MDCDVLALDTAALPFALHVDRPKEVNYFRRDARRSGNRGEDDHSIACETRFLLQLTPGGFLRAEFLDESSRKVDHSCVHRCAKLFRKDQSVVVGDRDDRCRFCRSLAFDEFPSIALQDDNMLPLENLHFVPGSSFFDVRASRRTKNDQRRTYHSVCCGVTRRKCSVDRSSDRSLKPSLRHVMLKIEAICSAKIPSPRPRTPHCGS